MADPFHTDLIITVPTGYNHIIGIRIRRDLLQSLFIAVTDHTVCPCCPCMIRKNRAVFQNCHFHSSHHRHTDHCYRYMTTSADHQFWSSPDLFHKHPLSCGFKTAGIRCLFQFFPMYIKKFCISGLQPYLPVLHQHFFSDFFSGKYRI